MKVKIKKLSADAAMPTKAHPSDAGFDLYAASEVVVPARERVLVPTDIAMEIPEGYFGLVTGRSGLTIREGIVGQVGVIDAHYRNGIGIMLFSHRDVNFTIRKGERCGQILILPLANVEGLVEVDTLTTTDRGEGGYGSTGR